KARADDTNMSVIPIRRNEGEGPSLIPVPRPAAAQRRVHDGQNFVQSVPWAARIGRFYRRPVFAVNRDQQVNGSSRSPLPDFWGEKSLRGQGRSTGLTQAAPPEKHLRLSVGCEGPAGVRSERRLKRSGGRRGCRSSWAETHQSAITTRR